MDKAMRQAVESLLLESLHCSADNHGFIQGLPMDSISTLLHLYRKWCRKHGKFNQDAKELWT